MWRAILGVVFLLQPVVAAAQSSPGCPAGGTERLRWHVPRVEHHNTSSPNNHCETVVLVTNLSPREALVQVDWQATGHDQCLQGQIASGNNLAFATAPTTPISGQLFPGLWGVLGSVVGQAGVHSSEGQIHVAAHLVCRDASDFFNSKLVAITELATLDLR